jgi:hypothetical protein
LESLFFTLPLTYNFIGPGQVEVLLGKKLLAVLAPAGLAVLLILADGCGAYNPNGTSGGGTGGSNPGQAQGFYSCTMENGFVMEALITPKDVFYGVIFQTLLANSFLPAGLVTGQGASGTDTYTGTFTEYVPQNSASATVTATDVPQASISGTITSSTRVGFGGAALPSSAYDFGTPASLSEISGTWTGYLLDGSAVTINVSSTGSITTTSAGCTISTTSGGQLTASTSNNLFTATLTFGSSCANALASQTTSTVQALVFVLPDNVTKQLLMPVTIGTTVGTVFVGQQ